MEIRNALAFKLYGNATGMPPTHRLVLRFGTSRSSLMLDPATALPSSENYGIDAQYNLIDLATNKSVMTGTTFSRVSYDIPGNLQRFARQRAFRDAEDRAAKEIAENIQTRLASFFSPAPDVPSFRGVRSTNPESRTTISRFRVHAKTRVPE